MTMYEDETAPCPLCQALNDPTGELGNLVHYNCRGCGMWYNREMEPVIMGEQK